MEVGALLFILGLLAVVAAYLSRPLLQQRGLAVTEEDKEFSSLLARRDRILDSLEELDMDRAMGKINPQDYQRRRSELVEQGANVLRQLDELSQQPEAGSELETDEIEGSIEKELLQLRKQRSNQQATQYCPACGAEALAADRFCTQCGEPLAEEVTP